MSIQKPFTSALIEILVFSQPGSLMQHYAVTLPRHGFELVLLNSPRELFLRLGLQTSSIVLLSCPLPEAYMLASRIRLLDSSVGLIMMADFKGPDARVRALHSGVDLCLEPDVEQSELAAYLHSLFRRVLIGRPQLSTSAVHSGRTDGYSNGGDDGQAFKLNGQANPGSRQETDGQAARSLKWQLTDRGWTLVDPSGVQIPLTTAEREFINRLFATPAKRIGRAELMSASEDGAPDATSASRYIDVLVSRLRRKAQQAGVDLPVRSIHRWGYMFTGEI
jgi:DNA-binding response OmpR family regulator